MKPMVLDFETSISDSKHSGTFRDLRNDIYTQIYGSHPSTVCIEHSEEGFKRTLSPGASNLLLESDVIIGHNLAFDLSYVWHTDDIQDFIKRGGTIFDTQVAEYILSGQRHGFASLAEVQLIHLNKKTKEARISKVFKSGKGADVIIQKRDKYPRTFKLFDKYCYDDGASTLLVAQRQIKKLKAMGMLNICKVYNKYLMGLIETTTNGILVDIAKTEKTQKAFKLKEIELLKRAAEIVKDYWDDPRLPPFNVNSPTHKSALLFGGEIKAKERVDAGFYQNGNPKTKLVEIKIPVKGFGISTDLTTMSNVPGRYRTGKEIIDVILDKVKDPIIQEYCGLQRKSMNIRKLCSTYLEAFLRSSIYHDNDKVNRYLHPKFNNTQTATGRLSSSKPNLQNVVSKGGMEKYIKSQFIAPEGYVCCGIDYSQLEIYVQALLAMDKKLTQDLLDGIDFHIMRLSYAEDMTYDEVYKKCKIEEAEGWDLKRSKAKTISYQKAYGASPRKLALSTGLSEEIVNKIFKKEDEMYPNVKLFNESIRNSVENTKKLSIAKHIPNAKKGRTKYSKRFIGEIELLPVMKNALDADYDEELLRHIGYYQSITGKRYTFEEMANYDKFGKVRRGFSPTQMMNYSIQGTAADVVGMATAEVFDYVKSLDNNEVLMTNQIHDSLEFYIKKGCEHLTIPKIVGIMENTKHLFKKYLNVNIPFNFKVDVKIGENFYDMEEYK